MKISVNNAVSRWEFVGACIFVSFLISGVSMYILSKINHYEGIADKNARYVHEIAVKQSSVIANQERMFESINEIRKKGPLK